MRLGTKVQLARGVRLHFEAEDARISIGDGTHLGPRTEVRCRERIDIGARCRISWDVQITDTDFHQLEGAVVTVPVVIGDDVWIGMRVTILKGVHVGSGAVITAGSVVVSDVVGGCLVAGVPAKVVRSEVRWSN